MATKAETDATTNPSLVMQAAELEQYHPLTSELQKLVMGGDTSLANRLWFLLVLGLLPALCEELAFRGFILTGLSRRFRPWTAVLLSSFLFALYQMNVFQFAPHFIFGVILGATLLGERLSPLAVIGAIVVLGATILIMRYDYAST